MITKTTKTRWLNALRSNKYTKGTGKMRNKNRYDAMGVLCDATGNSKNRNMSQSYPRLDKDGTIQEFMGLSPSTQERINSINDSTNDFREVIRYISRNLKVKG